MAKKLTKAQVDYIFRTEILPIIRDQEKAFSRGRHSIDVLMRCEEYNNFVDSLQKDGQLTKSQAENYSIPKSLIGE
jgi:hypothetical protein